VNKMELKDEEILEQIKSHLDEVDDGEHKLHKLECLICVAIEYEDGKIKLKTFEVHQGECVSCKDRDGVDFPLLLWE